MNNMKNTVFINCKMPESLGKQETIELINVTRHQIELEVKKNRNSLYVVPTADVELWGDVFSVLGLRFGEDYMDMLAFSYAYKIEEVKNKKLLVAYGNCQINDYYKCMSRTSDFCDKYDCAYFKYMEYPRWKEDRLEFLLRNCDVLLYIKDTFDKRFRNCFEYVKKYNESCMTIGIPAYSFRGYFPQSNPHIQAKAKYDIISEAFNTFHREDTYINSLLEKGVSVETIISHLSDYNFIPENEIKKNNELSLLQIKNMDRLSDVSIYDFVVNNYKDIRLFKDPVHFSDVLVFHIVKQLLKKLKCVCPEDYGEATIHKFTEMPVYPCVAKTLHLNWFDSAGTTALRIEKEIINITFEEYIENYYEFCKAAKTIKDFLIRK